MVSNIRIFQLILLTLNLHFSAKVSHRARWLDTQMPNHPLKFRHSTRFNRENPGSANRKWRTLSHR